MVPPSEFPVAGPSPPWPVAVAVAVFPDMAGVEVKSNFLIFNFVFKKIQSVSVTEKK